ncbi:hypothetical protein MRX96_000245 [Rhipicephalus microplus]
MMTAKVGSPCYLTLLPPPGLYAVSGRTGTVLWTLSAAEDAVVERSNMYTAQHIRDVDDDGTADLLIAHGGDPLREPGAPSDRLAGRLLVVSGRSGKLLSWAMVPDSRETYYSPQLMLYPDGTELVLFGTGGRDSRRLIVEPSTAPASCRPSW